MTYMPPLTDMKSEIDITAMMQAASSAVSVGAMPKRFSVEDEVIYFQPPKPAKTEEEPVQIAVCQTFMVVGRTTDEQSQAPGTMIKWFDKQNIEHEWIVPDVMLVDDKKKLAIALAGHNFSVESGAPALNALHQLFSEYKKNISKNITRYDRCGWQSDGKVFLLQNGESYGGINSRIENKISSRNKQKGNLSEWSSFISGKIAGNSRLIFAMSVGFTGPLLEIMNEGCAMFHLVGESSKGKSTAAIVAASIWGRPDETDMMRSWRATDNGLEGIAAGSTDTLLVLDEMEQADPRIISSTIYMLGNGISKQRATQIGESRATKTWRIAVLSTGEHKADDAARTVGKKPAAGVDVRMINIPSDAGKGIGVFENCHGMEPVEFAKSIQNIAIDKHGVAGREFIQSLMEFRHENTAALIDLIKKIMNEFLAKVPKHADGQVQRVARKFALVGAAGELASMLQVSPLPSGVASDAAQRCFIDWLDARGSSTQARESMDVISAVRDHLEKYGSSRFDNPVPGDYDRPSHERSGWAKNGNWYFLPGVFSTLVAPMPVGTALKILYDAGYVECAIPREGNKKSYRTSLKVEQVSVMTVCIKPEILE